MDAQEFEIALKECETRLDRLRALFEQYFQGMERREPSVPKKELFRRVQALRRNVPRNTALRFRYQALLQKYTTYQTYWMRIARQIEEGTYHRHVANARRQRQGQQEKRPELDSQRPNPRDGISLDVDLDSMDIEAEVAAAMGEATESAAPASKADDVFAALDQIGPRSIPAEGRNGPSLSPFATPSQAPGAQIRPLTPLPTLGSMRPRQGTVAGAGTLQKPKTPTSRTFGKPSPDQRPSPPKPPPPPRAAKRPAPPPPSSGARGGAGEDARMRKIYDSYVDARRRNNERVDNLRFESIKKTIQKQLPKLQAKHKGKKIDFEVVVRNGKVGLKPVPK